VRFRDRGKSYYFDPGALTPAEGDKLVVETSKGLELGDCVEGVHEVAEEKVVSPLRAVVRLATAEDLRIGENNRKKEKDAFVICEDRIAAHGLDMKLVDVEYSFEGNKILFFFTSDGRVDFRELVKDLASRFHTRIELRQIGVRDASKMLGGLGICGRPFCCSTFLEDFQPVSIRMAKTQSLSLNPSKISGTCGRLMCCLKFEQAAYEDLVKSLPKADAQVDTPKGKGTVTEVNLLRRTVKVRLEDPAETAVQTYSVDRLGYTLGGVYIEPKPEEVKPVVSDLPDLSRYMSDSGESMSAKLAAAEAQEKKNRGRGRNKNKGRPKEARNAGERQENRQPSPQKGGKGQRQQPAAKNAARAEKPEGGERKNNYHRRTFHRGSKKGGGSAGKTEG